MQNSINLFNGNNSTVQTTPTVSGQSPTMTSLQIAEVSGKRHAHVLEAIRKMENAWEKVNGTKFRLVEYRDSKGENRPMYELTKTECLYIATKFNDEARAKLVLRWEQLENQTKQSAIQLPTNYIDALKALVASEEQKERLQLTVEAQANEMKLSAPKVQYYDTTLSSTGLLTVNMIASCLGISAVRLNKLLCDWGIQYKQSGVYFLYERHRDKGYAVHKPFPYTDSNGEIKTRQQLYWTEKGKEAIIKYYNTKITA